MQVNDFFLLTTFPNIKILFSIYFHTQSTNHIPHHHFHQTTFPQNSFKSQRIVPFHIYTLLPLLSFFSSPPISFSLSFLFCSFHQYKSLLPKSKSPLSCLNFQPNLSQLHFQIVLIPSLHIFSSFDSSFKKNSCLFPPFFFPFGFDDDTFIHFLVSPAHNFI